MRKQILVAAVVFGLAGSLSVWLTSVYAQGSNGEALTESIVAGVSALVVSGLLWYLVALKKRATGVSVRRGALVGGLIGFLSHPVYWYLYALIAWAFLPPSVGGPSLGPIQGLGASLMYSLISWLLVGWITVLVGAVAGGLLAAVGPKPQITTQT